LQSTIKQALQNIRQTADGTIEATALFPLSAPIFSGHFPGRPIVPAVYQIALCRAAFETFFPSPFVQLVRSRFSLECVPDVSYAVKVSREENVESVVATCSIKQGGVMHSKIVLLYGREPAQG
jgi:3-hydroxymyristoyl/3-hydroxydecanoyl-(acyl carrier protein) dehydratase